MLKVDKCLSVVVLAEKQLLMASSGAASKSQTEITALHGFIILLWQMILAVVLYFVVKVTSAAIGENLLISYELVLVTSFL